MNGCVEFWLFSCILFTTVLVDPVQIICRGMGNYLKIGKYINSQKRHKKWELLSKILFVNTFTHLINGFEIRFFWLFRLWSLFVKMRDDFGVDFVGA